MTRYVRTFDEIPAGVVVDKAPAVVRREVVSHGSQRVNLRYNWQELFNYPLVVCYSTVLLILGLLLIVCGVMSFLYYTYYYSLAIPIWFGILVFIGGFLGLLTACVRRACTIFLYLIFALICTLGGLALTVVFSLAAYYDSDHMEQDSWGCAYDLISECNVYARNRDAMVIIGAVIAAVSFFVFVFGLLSVIAALQPWVECLRPTNPCCKPTDPLCFCCCFTPDETRRAYGQPSQLYQPADQPYVQNKASMYGAPQAAAYSKPQPLPITYGQPAVTYGQPAVTYGQPAVTYGQPAVTPVAYSQPAIASQVPQIQTLTY